MIKFLKQIFYFSFPIVTLLSVLYFVMDPFYVLYDHGDDYFVSNGTPDAYTLNRDFVATEMFLRKHELYNYNSFVFGNSRSTAFLSRDWKPHLRSDASIFHFNGGGEKLIGMHMKFALIEKYDVNLENVIIVIDHNLLTPDKIPRGPRGRFHYMQTENFLKFQLEYFLDYITTDFFLQYFAFKIFNYKGSLSEKIFENDQLFRQMKYDNRQNDWIFIGDSISISKNEDSFYNARKNIFPKRKDYEAFAERKIDDSQLLLLNDIKLILEKHNSDYRVVISPLYDQLKIDSIDLIELNKIFGDERVYNFSGKNEITENIRNYYEFSHYRPKVGSLILDSLYTSK